MVDQPYSKKVMELFLHPKNMGKIKDADGVGRVGNERCGDIMEVFIKVKNNRIKDIKFQTYGCAAAIATSSIITELAKNKTLDEALKIKKEDVIKKAGGLPVIKIHCSALADEALRAAIDDYKKKAKK